MKDEVTILLTSTASKSETSGQTLLFESFDKISVELKPYRRKVFEVLRFRIYTDKSNVKR
jgi:hypothetical protein